MDLGFEEVREERRGAIAIWTIARPDRANALSRAVVRRLTELAAQAAVDRDLRVAILTGAGGRAFSAGADLKERAGMDEATVLEVLDELREAFDAIDALPKPIIAAVEGFALGGGLELALACDLRVAGPSAELGLPEVSLAIIPGAGGTQRLTRTIGPARAKELILFARRVDAEEAERIGLVSRVAASGRTALDEALAWADVLAKQPPIAVAAALEAIDGGIDRPLAEALDHERTCYTRTLHSKDRLEALAAFREKRAAVFRGE